MMQMKLQTTLFAGTPISGCSGLHVKRQSRGAKLRLVLAAGKTYDVPAEEVKQLTSQGKPGIAAPLQYKPLTAAQKAWTAWNLLRVLPWRRFKKGSILTFKLGGEIGDQPSGFFNKDYSLSQITTALSNAAVDPRVAGIFVTITPLAIGWAKVQELRRHIDLFRQSGKVCISYMYTGGEKEYYLSTAFSEYYCAPSASLSLRGFAVTGSFVAGVLEKAGVQPQVKRLGKYKSAGDQLARKDMSEAQREQLTALLDDIYDHFRAVIAGSAGKSEAEVADMLDAGYVDIQDYVKGGWLTGLKYNDEIEADLEQRLDCKKDKLRKVSLQKYVKLSPATFTSPILGGKRVAIIRASGNITGAEEGGGLPGPGITANQVIKQVRDCRKDRGIAAVVLRVDSPGGEATASDLMWREIRQLSKRKPVVASMGDVAASGGYYMAMGTRKIVAESLTITGSIGVVTAKFNLEELYRRIGFAKEVISRGKFAEVLQESRGFTQEEEDWFDRGAKSAYHEFRNKAAESRGMSPDGMEDLAQGRVWSGQRALQVGLVDSLGGLSAAVQLAKQLADIGEDEAVKITEVVAAKQSPLALLRGASLALTASLQAVNILACTGLLGKHSTSPAFIEQLVLRLSSASASSTRSSIMAHMPDITVMGSNEL